VVVGLRDPEADHGLHSVRGVRVAQLDVVDPKSVDAFRDGLRNRPVDVLINNAGVIGGERQSLRDMDYDSWRHALEVNTLAPFRVTTALLPNLEQAERAKVVTLTSQMGSLHGNSIGHFAYRSSKAAANKVMQVMAWELRDRGIVVCPVHPGWVRTEMGGPQAEVSVHDSVLGLIALIERLELGDSGRFWTWQGQEHPW
jgi:NAD(P)-dependent dehydrogenase (short-subunit alcohol dehydrogenase family)